ncbi:MAG TPA: ABC transporter ATP-binding protein [Chitinophagales bacterium]|nr:ABC transporter ATP-binding protein [Chitinophagales bacterium]HMU69585.1 ABC transporter ATP-binding protein [Chitinophagales bacterium]HMZ89983.1 ABC transporter ATP-binding protein [Chitinophagales bacterium]HNA56848.1 ABC transporter ATP-binding protein [Chitinophagales bacterium]HNE46811.1 ABC transporter ATP-binding protein [Chitinophagales bacterium]
MIQIDHLSKSYKSVHALNDLSLTFTAGQSIALTGPNGSGKSTLMKCLLGLVFPDKGNITVNNLRVDKGSEYRRFIGYMPQIVQFPENMRVRQLFKMMRDIRQHDGNYDEDLYTAFDIQGMADKYLGSLSGGMKQKVNAGLALLFNPKIIIMDEPTAGLDPLSAELLKDKLRKEKEKGKLIIISSHILSDLEEITNHVLFLMDGKVICNKSLPELIAESGTENLSRAIAKLMDPKIAGNETR